MAEKTKQTKQDPIEAAIKAANAKQLVARIRRTSRERFTHSAAERALVDAQERIWCDAVARMRRAFRAEFRAEAWRRLSIEFRGRGYSTRYDTYATGAYVEYSAMWYGLVLSRHFCPESLADVKAEAWRLGGVLVAWKENA